MGGDRLATLILTAPLSGPSETILARWSSRMQGIGGRRWPESCNTGSCGIVAEHHSALLKLTTWSSIKHAWTGHSACSGSEWHNVHDHLAPTGLF